MPGPELKSQGARRRQAKRLAAAGEEDGEDGPAQRALRLKELGPRLSLQAREQNPSSALGGPGVGPGFLVFARACLL